MAKTGKQNNDLRTVRKETAIVIAASGLFCLLLFMTAVWQSDINPLLCGVFVLVLYAAACAAAVWLPSLIWMPQRRNLLAITV